MELTLFAPDITEPTNDQSTQLYFFPNHTTSFG